MDAPIYVNKQGVADKAAPYVREAINKLRGNASAAAATRASTVPGSGVTTPQPAPKAGSGIAARLRSAGTAAKNAAPKVTGAVTNPTVRRIASKAAGYGGAAQAVTGGLQMAGGDKVGGAENAMLGTLTAIPTAPTRAAGIVGNVLKAGRDAVLPGIAERYRTQFLGDKPENANIVGPALEAQLAGRTPAQYLEETGRASKPPTTTTAPAVQQPGVMPTQLPAADPATLQKQIADPGYVPARGTGIAQNVRTGNTMAFDARNQIAAEDAQRPMSQEIDYGDPEKGAVERQQVVIPNLAMAMDINSLGDFLSGMSGAAQTIANNNIASANEKGIARRAKSARENKKLELENAQNNKINTALEQLIGLDDAADPDGSKRADLRQMLADIRGTKGESDSAMDRYLRDLTKSVFNDGVVTDEDRAKAQAFVDEQMARYAAQRGGQAAAPTPPPGYPPGSRKAPDGKWYVQQNGKWHMVEGG